MTKLNLYELVEQYTSEGYSAEEAENMAWRMIQGNPDNWQEVESESSENNFEETTLSSGEEK